MSLFKTDAKVLGKMKKACCVSADLKIKKNETNWKVGHLPKLVWNLPKGFILSKHELLFMHSFRSLVQVFVMDNKSLPATKIQ